jgi:hypothetical protein
MRPVVRACAASMFVLALALASAGCDWRKFDDLKTKTPVAAISAPSNYPAKNDFGTNLLAVLPPSDGSAAGRFVAAATYSTSVAVVSFDASGSPSGVGVVGNAFDALAGGPITSMAVVPDKRQVLLGAPTPEFGDVLLMELDKPNPTGSLYPTTTFRAGISEKQYGVGVGAGHIGGGAAPELVVLSENVLHVFVDGLATTEATRILSDPDPCPLFFSPDLPESNRAVLVASLLGPGMQIAVGTPVVSGSGHVTVFAVDLAATPPVFTCPVVLTGTEPHFGRAMTVVDRDGDGTPDHLLVGAPPTHAYLYSLPLTAGQTPETVTDPEPMPNGQFGASVAAFDVDGTPGDEMFIGNPDGSVGGMATAGRVSVYKVSPLALVPTTVAPNPLAEHDPGAGRGYGTGIAGMLFCPGNVGGADGGTGTSDGGVAACKPLPIIGSLSTVYAYFTLNKPDPRVK